MTADEKREIEERVEMLLTRISAVLQEHDMRARRPVMKPVVYVGRADAVLAMLLVPENRELLDALPRPS